MVSTWKQSSLRTRIAILIAGLAGGAVLAQSSENEVHIVPRTTPPPAVAGSAANGEVASLNTHTRPLRSDVDLVLVPVTVTDPDDRLVTGLDKENFAVFDDNSKQEIRHLSTDDMPISVGVIFDVSGSMSDKMEKAREAGVQFLETGNPEDEFFVIAFSDKPELLAGFTDSIGDIRSRLAFTVPKGRTALLDAIYLGLDQMRRARHRRKALLIISDGGDNHSRYTEGEVRKRVKEADVQIFGIGLYDPAPPTPEERFGPVLLSDITEATGGRTFTVTNPNELPDVATKISMQLRNQYVLAYAPAKKPKDGKWHKIRVKLLPPKGLPPLHVYAKHGYYASEP